MFVRAEFSYCRDYLVRSLNKGCGIENPVHVYKIENGQIPKTENGDLPWSPVVDNFDASYDLITNDGDEFYFQVKFRLYTPVKKHFFYFCLSRGETFFQRIPKYYQTHL